MSKNIEHVQHLKSKMVVDGSPKLPNPSDLTEGEIAINYAEGYETISIKNSSGNISTFVSVWDKGTGANSVLQKGGNNVASGGNSVAEGFGTTASGASSHAEGTNTRAIGPVGSHAEGQNTTASGGSSHAEGAGTFSIGYYSHAEGSSTQAIGSQSHAEGYVTFSIGSSSHAEGEHTQASGASSHAEGSSTQASGASSHAEGASTKASGNYSHAEGTATSAMSNSSHAEGNNTKAIGEFSHSEGFSTIASGNVSHAEGQYTTANGALSHTEGSYTVANGAVSHTEGSYTVANGAVSHVEGNYTVTNNQYEHASGYYNISVSATTELGDSGNTLFSIGNGTAGNARHNAFEVRQNGDIYITSGGTDILLQDSLGGVVDQVIDSGTSASTNAVSTSAVYGFVTSYTPSITVDQVLDNTTSASTNPVSSKAVYDAVTDNELVWTNAYIALSGVVSSHTEDTTVHVTSGDRTKWDSAYEKTSGITATTAAINSLSGAVGSMAFQNTSSYSSATEVNTALSAKADKTEDLDGVKIKKITQSAYDALVQAGTVDPNTLYVITD